MTDSIRERGRRTAPRRTLSSKRADNFFVEEMERYAGDIQEQLQAKSLDSGSNQAPNDNLEAYTGGGVTIGNDIIHPPYSLYALAKLPNNNSILKQCIDVMVTNIESNGHRLEYIGPKKEQETKASKAEYETIKAFIDNPNGDYSMIELRERVRLDYETLGNAYIEVIRNRSGKITSLYHIPAHTMRLTAHDPRTVTATAYVMDENGKYVEKTYRRKFRRFAQIINGRHTFFKEMGDPRTLNPVTGMFENDLAFDSSATEIYHFAEYNPGNPYGLPRWFNQLPAIMGSREAELTNLDYFQENAMPAMAVLISGGSLTNETMDELDATFTNIRGRSAQNRVLVVEAVGDIEAADDTGKIPAPKVELKPLVDERQGDALFENYEKACADKIRSAFRIPPIYLGTASDYNRATADRSMIIGESQIFSPERRKFDEFLNMKVLSVLKPKYWRYKGLPPKASGTVEIMLAIEGLSAVGAITPNAAINLTNEMLDMQVKPIEDEWGDRPFFLTQAQAQHGLFGDIGIGENVEKPAPAAPGQAKPDNTGKPTPPSEKTSRLTKYMEDAENKVNEFATVAKTR